MKKNWCSAVNIKIVSYNGIQTCLRFIFFELIFLPSRIDVKNYKKILEGVAWNVKIIEKIQSKNLWGTKSGIEWYSKRSERSLIKLYIKIKIYKKNASKMQMNAKFKENHIWPKQEKQTHKKSLKFWHKFKWV